MTLSSPSLLALKNMGYMRVLGKISGVRTPVDDGFPVREEGARRRRAPRDLPPLPGHAPEAVPADSLCPCPGVLLARTCSEGVKVAVVEVAFPDFVALPSVAVEAALVDCVAAVQGNELEAIF